MVLVLTPDNFDAQRLPLKKEDVELIVDSYEQYDIILYVDSADIDNPIEILLKG